MWEVCPGSWEVALGSDRGAKEDEEGEQVEQIKPVNRAIAQFNIIFVNGGIYLFSLSRRPASFIFTRSASDKDGSFSVLGHTP